MRKYERGFKRDINEKVSQLFGSSFTIIDAWIIKELYFLMDVLSVDSLDNDIFYGGNLFGVPPKKQFNAIISYMIG